MHLATVLMSFEMAPVWRLRLEISAVRICGAAKLLRLSSVSVSGRFNTTTDSDWLARQLIGAPDQGVETSPAQAHIFRE